MIRVLVIANDSLLPDAMEWALTQEMDLEVLRLTHFEQDKIYQVLREHCVEVMIVAEGVSEELITGSDLLRTVGRLLVITVSPQNTHLHVYESYQMPNPGMAQVVKLVRAFSGT